MKRHEDNKVGLWNRMEWRKEGEFLCMGDMGKGNTEGLTSLMV